MVCLPSNPINEIYDILTLIVRNTKALAGESAPTCVCHGSTGKVPVLQPQCSPPALCLSPRAPQCHVSLWGKDPGSALRTALFCVLGPVLHAGRGFLLCSFSRKELKAISLSLGKGQGVPLQSASSDPSSGGWKGGQWHLCAARHLTRNNLALTSPLRGTDTNARTQTR